MLLSGLVTPVKRPAPRTADTEPPATPSIPAPRDGWADALEEARELQGASFERRYALLESACRLVFSILEAHPDREQILSYRESPAHPLDALAASATARH